MVHLLLLVAGVAVAAGDPPQLAASWRCVEVLDGDSLRLDGPEGTVEVRLFGVDAPELAQPRGADARAFLEALVLNREVELERRVAGAPGAAATVTVDGKDLARELAAAGFAWLPNAGETSEEYAIAVFTARSQRLGLWADAEQLHPVNWSEQQRKEPTPVPKRTLSQLASTVRLEKNADGKAVIAGIPSMVARNAEAALFIARMEGLLEAVADLQAMEQLLERCSRRAAASEGEGSVWSESRQEWVPASGEQPRINCEELEREYDELRREIREHKATAVAEAKRGGVSVADVDYVVEACGLKGY